MADEGIQQSIGSTPCEHVGYCWDEQEGYSPNFRKPSIIINQKKIYTTRRYS